MTRVDYEVTPGRPVKMEARVAAFLHKAGRGRYVTKPAPPPVAAVLVPAPVYPAPQQSAVPPAPESPEAPPRRGRGRPRKVRPENENAQTAELDRATPLGQ